jgi:tRNA (guanine-N7-)-methyltransferase
MSEKKPLLDYSATSFSTGRMDFAWEELTEYERRRAYADWDAGKGLIGGDPRRRPGSDRLPPWGVGKPFFRLLALDDPAADNGERLRERLGASTRVEVEIGFGRGDFLLDRAAHRPATLFFGYETKTRATRLLLRRIERLGLDNVWVSDDDCRFNMPRMFLDNQIDIVHVLFPDPWWKDQHRVKRLFSPPFVELLAAKLRRAGLLHFKSDVQAYGELVSYLIGRHGGFSPNRPELARNFGDYARTHREQWCVDHDLPVFTYAFAKQ